MLGQSAHGVCREFDGDLAVAGQMQVGMMVFGIGNFRDLLKKAQRGVEILDLPLFANGFAVGAIVGEIVPIAFFCPAGRYLNAIPSNCCARV